MVSNLIFESKRYSYDILFNTKYFEQDYFLFRKKCPFSLLYKELEQIPCLKKISFYGKMLSELLDYVSVDEIRQNRLSKLSGSYFFKNEQQMQSYIKKHTGIEADELFTEEVEALMLCTDMSEVDEICAVMVS